MATHTDSQQSNIIGGTQVSRQVPRFSMLPVWKHLKSADGIQSPSLSDNSNEITAMDISGDRSSESISSPVSISKNSYETTSQNSNNNPLTPIINITSDTVDFQWRNPENGYYTISITDADDLLVKRSDANESSCLIDKNECRVSDIDDLHYTMKSFDHDGTLLMTGETVPVVSSKDARSISMTSSDMSEIEMRICMAVFKAFNYGKELAMHGSIFISIAGDHRDAIDILSTPMTPIKIPDLLTTLRKLFEHMFHELLKPLRISALTSSTGASLKIIQTAISELSEYIPSDVKSLMTSLNDRFNEYLIQMNGACHNSQIECSIELVVEILGCLSTVTNQFKRLHMAFNTAVIRRCGQHTRNRMCSYYMRHSNCRHSTVDCQYSHTYEQLALRNYKMKSDDISTDVHIDNHTSLLRTIDGPSNRFNLKLYSLVDQNSATIVPKGRIISFETHTYTKYGKSKIAAKVFESSCPKLMLKNLGKEHGVFINKAFDPASADLPIGRTMGTRMDFVMIFLEPSDTFGHLSVKLDNEIVPLELLPISGNVCRHWQRGYCKLGDACTFTHPSDKSSRSSDRSSRPSSDRSRRSYNRSSRQSSDRSSRSSDRSSRPSSDRSSRQSSDRSSRQSSDRSRRSHNKS
jgi:zinc finger (C-x8-C-x5-C-x3-H type) protein